MQTVTNNTEPTTVMTTRTGNLKPQQIFHVKTFKVLGCLQIVLGVTLILLSLVDFLPTLILSEWFVMTGCLPICMSENTKSSLKCRKSAFMVCSVIGAVIFGPSIFMLSLLTGSLYANTSEQWYVLSFSITALSIVLIIVAVVSATFCCCWEHRMVVCMSLLQP
ncbi:uncharacterized protein [Mytilus edulis]|uniref:uncharacterized protein isoform X2 n=1 Tax=Mytilus edulis TaxID=6550 RepID=UPI0039EE196E